MFNQSHTVYITPLVINALGGGHTHTHIPTHKQKQFQETKDTKAIKKCKARRQGTAWFKKPLTLT